MYGCTEAFLADIKWILHNCIIYNGGRQVECMRKHPFQLKLRKYLAHLCLFQVITN